MGGLFAPGYTLSLEERAVLEVEMAKRKAAEKLARLAICISAAATAPFRRQRLLTPDVDCLGGATRRAACGWLFATSCNANASRPWAPAKKF